MSYRGNGGYQQPPQQNYYNNGRSGSSSNMNMNMNNNYRNNYQTSPPQNRPQNRPPPQQNRQPPQQNRPPMQQIQMNMPQPVQPMQPMPQPRPMPQPYGIKFANQGISIPVPNSQLLVKAQKRAKTYKKVKLTKEGNLIVDCPVPDRVLQFGHYKEGEEFTHMRYTAATCDPDEFAKKGYTLRQMIYRRQTEMFIVLTMYNEDDLLFAKSMTAVMKNISYLCSRDRSKTWGSEGWKKVTVCIVADGRSKIHPRVLTTLGIMGVYQEGVAKNQVNGKDVTAHIFEYTTQMCIDSDLKIRGYEQGMVPVQILFCLKEKNAKKINSHRWFFNAFGQLLMPNVCVLIDVGTKPSGTSLYHLWKVFDRDQNVAGACGEICAELGHRYVNLLNPLIASQNFEYKMSNILDKPTESIFGYISVLPGAFSAYRFRALQNVTPTDGPLYAYFKGELLHGNPDASIFDANMYLAEDRILCFELVTKRNESWLLRYVKEAKAETDVPDNIPEFISQRRRWLNGSFFAAVYASSQCLKILRSGHSLVRKLILAVEFVYNFINVVFSWFMISNFYLSFYFIANSDSIVDMLKNLHIGLDIDGGMLFYALRQLYLFAIIVTFISSMGNRPQGSKWIYMFCIILFAFIMIIMLCLAFYTAYAKFSNLNGEKFFDVILHKQDFRDICVSLLATYGLYFVSSFIHLEPWHMFNSLIQYLVLLPAYTNILMVYAFCNTHDVSWGTKGDNSSKTDLGVVVTKAGKDGALTAEMELFTEKQDINSNYERFLQEIRNRPEEVKSKRDAKTKQEDLYRSFRTRMVLSWMFTNCFVVVIVTLDAFQPFINRRNEDASHNVTIYNPYLSFLLWSAVALAAIRFVCTSLFLLKGLICK